jgi:hypothetical protein
MSSWSAYGYLARSVLIHTKPKTCATVHRTDTSMLKPVLSLPAKSEFQSFSFLSACPVVVSAAASKTISVSDTAPASEDIGIVGLPGVDDPEPAEALVLAAAPDGRPAGLDANRWSSALRAIALVLRFS